MKLAPWGLAILLVVPLGSVSARPQQSSADSAQSQQDSLVAAARRAREQQKQQPKAAKVWTNDNIPSNNGISVVGQPPAPSAPAAAAPSAATKSTLTPAEKKALESQLAAAKKQLATFRTDLSILQRKMALDQQSYYGQTNYASDTAGAARLKVEQDAITAKTAQVAAAQKAVEAIQAKLAAGGEKPETSGSQNSGSQTQKSNTSVSASGSSAASGITMPGAVSE